MVTNKKSEISRIGMTLPKKLLEKIDKARGLIPRSTFIVEKLKRVRWGK